MPRSATKSTKASRGTAGWRRRTALVAVTAASFAIVWLQGLSGWPASATPTTPTTTPTGIWTLAFPAGTPVPSGPVGLFNGVVTAHSPTNFVPGPPSGPAILGQGFSFTFSSAAYQVPTMTSRGAVTGLSYTRNANCTGTLAGTPENAGTCGTTVTAGNSGGSLPQKFILTVSRLT